MTWLRPFELALLAAAVLAALELVTGTLIMLGLAIGCVGVAVAELVIGDFNLYRDALVFAVLAALCIAILRFAFARPGDTVRAKGDVNEY